MTNDAIFNEKLTAYLNGINAKIDAYWNQCGYTHQKPTIHTDDGRRYVRIYQDTGSQHMCWGFIDKTNGDVLKAAGWKAPAKHARGNIYNTEAALARCDWNGPNYLR